MRRAKLESYGTAKIKILLTFVFFSLIANVKSNGKTKDEKPKKGRDRKQKDKGEAQLQAEQEEAERLEKERLEREHLKKLEEKYQGARESELAELNSLEQKFLSAQQWKMDYREQAKWEHYLSCDGSPDPTVPQEMNTFMSLWREDQDESVQLVMEKGEVVLKVSVKMVYFSLNLTAPTYSIFPFLVAK
ncbi:dynein intermediate chain CFAP94, axonemal-like isoform X5 [Corvus kubaryi]|uniref:dynein intermediate chain CFAP94, axonemal-like isoform X5 n=1 Tax=Corvus kubaryi TaxID=68294 RepID=UPI001C05A5D8|nr:dynein intermediate chain CFAP94, axonemal-like isoform X5 [Corvus kubaryi]